MENICIRVLNEKHGKKVIQYFKSKSIDTQNCKGIMIDNYYGLFNGRFSFYDNPQNSKVMTLEELEQTEKSFPRKMIVYNSNNDKKKKIVIGHFPNATYPFVVVCSTNENNFWRGDKYDISTFQHAEEIEEIEEMTLEQVCKALGKNIKIIK